jgi:hypothetical protein
MGNEQYGKLEVIPIPQSRAVAGVQRKPGAGGLNEESSAPPALRAGQWEKERIVVPEEEGISFSSAFPFLIQNHFDRLSFLTRVPPCFSILIEPLHSQRFPIIQKSAMARGEGNKNPRCALIWGARSAGLEEESDKASEKINAC